MLKSEKLPPILTLIRHTGMVTAGRSEEYWLIGSPEELQPVLSDITHKNLKLGWWSPLSIFINPSIILGNYVLFYLYQSRFNRFYKNEHNQPTKVMFLRQNSSTGIAAGLFKYAIPTILFFIAVIMLTLLTQ